MSTTANGNQSPRPQPPTSLVGSGRELAIPMKKSVAFFDLDKTIIATSSAYAYGKEFFNSGLITPAEALQMSMAKASYMFSGHSSEQMDASKDQLSQMVAGWDVEEIKKIATETMHEVVVPAIYAEARDLINRHRGQGRDVAIISASASTLVEPIAAELGVETVIASRLEEKDGKFTGNITFYCKGPAKAQAIAALSAEKSYDLAHSFAYSDSVTDLPMLEAVGTPVAVNPDRALRKIAQERGWEIQTFKNPVPLVPLPSGKQLSIGTGVLVGLAAVTAGIFLTLKRNA